jgi:shikimate 5-dehydrogenase
LNKFEPSIDSYVLSLSCNAFCTLEIPEGISCIEYRHDLYPTNLTTNLNALHLITDTPILFTDHSYSGVEEYAQRIGCTMIEIDMQNVCEFNIYEFNIYPNTYIIASIYCDDYDRIVETIETYLDIAINKNNIPDIIKIVADSSIKDELDRYVAKLETKYKVIHLYNGCESRMSSVINKYLTPVWDGNYTSIVGDDQLSIRELVDERATLYMGSDRIKQYCLFGTPIGHSNSPEIHNEFFDKQNQLAIYYTYETDNAIVAFHEFQKNNLCGASITCPLKEEIKRYVNILSEDVIYTGVLNTLTRLENGQIRGDNTDWLAIYDELYKLDLQNRFITNRPIRTCVIGTGASAKSASYAIKKLGHTLYIIGWSQEKLDYFHQIYDATIVNDNMEFISMDIIIVTIPGNVELDISLHTDCSCVIDMAYNPIMKRKYPKFAKIIDGRAILYEQAKYQNKIWRKTV